MSQEAEEAAIQAAESDWSIPSTHLAAGVLAAVAIFVLVDVVHDMSLGAELEHLVVEAGLMALAVGAVAIFLRRWMRERQASASSLAAARHEAHHWRSRAQSWRSEAQVLLRGLGTAIEKQFSRWELSRAEQEVAMLLLKGLSHKEIAAIREVSERTCRQQARAVYKKASLAGRAELSAFFLEDLLLPDEQRS